MEDVMSLGERIPTAIDSGKVVGSPPHRIGNFQE